MQDRMVDFVDGGTLSNFPLELFYDLAYPSLVTTLGAHMGDVPRRTSTRTLPKLLMAIFNNSRRILDQNFITKRRGHPGVATIDTSEFSWLDFDMSLSKQVALLEAGCHAASNLLLK